MYCSVSTAIHTAPQHTLCVQHTQAYLPLCCLRVTFSSLLTLCHDPQKGDILLVSQGDPLGDSHEAIVVDFSSRWIRLAMNPTAAAAVAAAAGSSWSSSSSSGSNGGGIRRNWRPIWRLDLFANTVSHERCSEALHRFAGAVTQQQQQQQGSAGEFVDRQGLLSGLLTQGQLQQQEALCRVLAGVVSPGG